MYLFYIISCFIMATGVFFFPFFLDHGIYLTGGWLISEGYVPYVEFIDNKPPGIYLWNALKVSLFSNRLGWAFMDFGVFAGMLLISSHLFNDISKNNRLLYVAAFAAFVFFPGVFEYGGLTEIYGSGLILFSILLLQNRAEFMAGVLAGLSVWFKEPFILFILYPVFIGGDFNKIKYLSGIFITAFTGLILLGIVGGLPAYLNIITSNIYYTQQHFLWEQLIPMNLEELFKLAFRLMPICLALFLTFKKQISSISLFFTVCGIISVVIGKRFFGHYFLFLVPAWLTLLRDLAHHNSLKLHTISVLQIIIVTSVIVQCYVIILQFPITQNQIEISKTIKTIIPKNKSLLTEISNGFIYPSARIRPAPMLDFNRIRDFYSISHGKIDPLKIRNIRKGFLNTPPDYLYYPENIFWFDLKWLSNYKKTNMKGLYRLQMTLEKY